MVVRFGSSLLLLALMVATGLRRGSGHAPRKLDLLFCKVCGSHAFDAHDHLPSLRLPSNPDNGATIRGQPLTPEQMGGRPLQYYSRPADEGPASTKANFTILRIDGHEALSAPSSFYHLASSNDDSSDENSPPTLLAAAFDSGVDVTVTSDPLPRAGSAKTITSGHHGGSAIPRQAINGYEQRAVQCGRCGSLLGYYLSKEDHKAPLPERQTIVGGKVVTTTTDATATTASALPTLSADSYRVLPFIEGEDDAALGQIEGSCLTLSHGGWWRYKWCHKKEVRQFHSDAATGHIDPDWSLGSWEGKKKKKAAKSGAAQKANGGAGKKERVKKPSSSSNNGGKKKSALYYTSHFYSNGQRCDENGKFRATEVQFYCCPTSISFGPHIEEITEPSLCRYIMKVCIPKLCVPVSTAAASSATTTTPPLPPPALESPAPSSLPSEGLSGSAATESSAGTKETVSTVTEGEGAAENTEAAAVDAAALPALPPPAGESAEKAMPPLKSSSIEGAAAPSPSASASVLPSPAATTDADAGSLPDSFILAFWGALVEDGGAELEELLSPASLVAHHHHHDHSDGDDDNEDSGGNEEAGSSQMLGLAGEREGSSSDPIYDRLPIATGISPVRFS